MSPTLTNFLFEAANFLLLTALLGWVLFKPVRRALDAERERHDSEKNEAERLRAEAESLAQEARSARRAAERDVEERRQEILAAAGKQASDLLDKARETQRAEHRALREELEATRATEAAALADTVGRIAADAVQDLLESLAGPSLDTALVKVACSELQALPAGARKAAVVESARALEEEQRVLLKQTLGDGFKERIVAELGAGVRVTTPAGQVDATAISIARRAARAVKSLNNGSREYGSKEAHHG